MLAFRGCAVAVCGLAALLASGCGGGGDRQDKDEPSGNWKVEVVDASFPAKQRLAEKVELRLRVRNADSRTLPNLAVTVDGFDQRSEQPGLADPNRPVWIIDDDPRGGVTAYTNTWALGRVKPGQTKEFVWQLTPVKAGRFEVKYRVAAGLDGKAKAVAPGGGPQPRGVFAGSISDKAPTVRVADDGHTIVSGTR